MKHDHFRNESKPNGFWVSRYAIGLLVLGAIAAFFLLSEHRAHFFGVLPYLLLMACPLMHVFMHHGHGAHRHGPGEKLAGPAKPGQANQGDSS